MLGYLIIILLFVGLILAIIAVLLGAYYRNLRGMGPHKPYRRAEFLLDPAEARAFDALSRACDGWSVPLCKVRLWDLLWVPSDTRKPERWRNRVWHKHADMVVCRPGDLRPLAVIALESDRARARLDDLRSVLKAAGIPMLLLAADDHFDPAGLRDRLRTLIAENPNIPAAEIAAGQLAEA